MLILNQTELNWIQPEPYWTGLDQLDSNWTSTSCQPHRGLDQTDLDEEMDEDQD